jgi:hypothetical protein
MRNDKMQLWVQDRGWRGSIVVIAITEAEARELMKRESPLNYSGDAPLQSFDLDAGFKHSNVGDL